jgi:hypothetical protein
MLSIKTERGSALQVMLAVLLIVALIVGTGLMVLGTRADNQRAARLATVERELAETRKRGAEIEARFNAALEAAHRRAQELEAQVNAERENTANVEAKLLQQQRLLAPRTVTSNQVRILVAALSGFEGQPVTLVTQAGSEETSRFGRQVQAIFEKAGLKVADGEGVTTSVVHTGIRLAVGERRSALAEAIRGALLEAKLTDSVVMEPNNNPDALWVMVGAKRI